MIDRLYSVSGEFDTMTILDKLFSTKHDTPLDISSSKQTSMKVLLSPVIAFWIGVPISEYWGGVVAAAIALVVLVLLYKYKFTVFDFITSGLIFILSLICIYAGMSGFILPVSYLAFGALWGISCVTAVPLTAYYSVNDYTEDYFNNPIFIRTNRILTLSWAVSYFVVGAIKYYIINSDIKIYSGAIPTLLFIAMGLYTSWFIKYYPAHIARKR